MAEENEVTVRELVVVDNGKPTLYNPAATAQLWRTAKLFSSSDLVPAAYKGKPENCFIAMEMAERMNVAPFAMLQNLVVIQGKPSMEAKLIIALVNDSGMFTDPIDFEVVGDDPYAEDYKVRAVATRAKTGKVCQGPWITYKMVKGEGWLDKGGSKWKTMPSLMFSYRAASFFAKLYAPNITMGMQSREELEDIEIEEIRDTQDDVRNRFAEQRGETRQIEDRPAVPGTDSDPRDLGQHEDTSHQTGQPPARKRGEPSHGNKRRTKLEMEEDAAADLADQQAAGEPAAANTAPPTGETVDTETGEVTDGPGPNNRHFDDSADPDPPGAAVQTAEPSEPVKTAEPTKTLPSGGVTLF